MLLAVTGSAACSPSDTTDRLVLEGAFDIPLIEGSFVPVDCFDDNRHSAYAPQGRFACVVFSVEQVERRPEHAYSQELYSQGWVLASGASVQYWMERQIEDSVCSQALDMSYVPFGAPREGEDRLEFSSYDQFQLFFELHSEPRCGDERYTVIMERSQRD